jgi:hypothetical protein
MAPLDLAKGEDRGCSHLTNSGVQLCSTSLEEFLEDQQDFEREI